MGIFIKDMKLPNCCDECLSGFRKTIGCEESRFFYDRDKYRPETCPLIEVDEKDVQL